MPFPTFRGEIIINPRDEEDGRGKSAKIEIEAKRETVQ
jgi:hypothetical protein